MSLNSYIIDANIEATLKNLTNSNRKRKKREPAVTLCLINLHLEENIGPPSLLSVCSVPSLSLEPKAYKTTPKLPLELAS